jgi:hypothetical protein
MSEPVEVWFVHRETLRGPWPALATLEPHKNGTPGAWAVLVQFIKIAYNPIIGYPRGFIAGHRYAIGTRVFLTELAAKRFLEGEADRYMRAPSNSYRRRFLPSSMMDTRAKLLAPPKVYK